MIPPSVGPYYHWLGHEADLGASSGSTSLRSPEPVPVSAHAGDDPARWFFRQYGYEKFSIYDERGTEIGFVHRRRDAQRIATECRA